MFRHAMVAAVMLLMLAACGKDEPAPPADQATPPAADASVAEPAEEAAPAEAPQEAHEVVEETAADTSGDQTITLAQADTPQPHEWKFKEGVNFTRLVPAQPTLGGADKIEVAEFFWYGCPHCYDFEPYINKWAKTKPANVRFVRIHAMWNQLLVMHARLFYTEQVLERNGIIKDPEAFRANVFAEYHRRNNRLASEDVIQKFFERNGVSADDFQRTWNSFEVDQKMRVAADLERRYSISSVPTIVVDGKYRTSAQEAGGVDELIELINELIARENATR